MAADAGRPLRAVQFAAAAGLDTKKAKVEGLRSRLKLLAARGWLAEAPRGNEPSLRAARRSSRKPGTPTAGSTGFLTQA